MIEEGREHIQDSPSNPQGEGGKSSKETNRRWARKGILHFLGFKEDEGSVL